MRHADAARARRARPASRCRTRWSASGRRSSAPPTRRAGSASSASTTSRGRCCAPRTTCAGWCARPPRTTSATGAGGWRSRSTPAGTPPASAGITAFTDLVLDAVRDASARTGLGIGVVIAANRTRHPLDARTLARLAAQYAGRGRGRLRALQRRAPRQHRRLRRRVRDRRARRAAAGAARRRAARARARAGLPRRAARRTGSATASARAEDPELLDRIVQAGVALEVCPVSNVALGVYSDLTSVPLPDAARGRRDRRPRRRRPAALRLPAGRRSTPPCAPRTSSTDDDPRRAGPDVAARLAGPVRPARRRAGRHRRLARATER